MKLQDLLEQEAPGTYAGAHFSPESQAKLVKLISRTKIPNGVPSDKLHTTLIYSRKHLPDFQAMGEISPPWRATPVKYDVWESQPDEDGKKSKCLVLVLNCPAACERHSQVMDEHGATYDFDEYTPHVTLSYDIGDFDVSTLPEPSEIGELKYGEEYQEDLNLNWAKDNT